ncbi:MAG: DUF3662 domain-containing protein [Chloroflexi bacterium]|nr:DUF3662 domain-containing protein [Chloroflexota bacterium]
MKNPFDHLERLLEGFVEGTSQRMLGARLQPAQVGRACAREMRSAVAVGLDSPIVPNVYEVRLAPPDYGRFESFRQPLSDELARYLVRLAEHHAWKLLAPVRVEIASRPSVRSGRVVVHSRFSDASAVSEAEETRTVARPAKTSRIEVVRRPIETVPGSSTFLLDGSGGRFPLRKPRVTLGRALENDVVLTDERVSRFHAELLLENGNWLLRDLGSTNGTQVALHTVPEATLQPGQTFSLGGYEMRLASDHAQGGG